MPALTGIRGIAALWVFLFHFPLMHEWAVLDNGYLGVDLFFILSGFILTYVYHQKLSLTRVDLLAFFRNRVMRIFPLHLVALACVVGAVVFVPDFTLNFAPGFFDWGNLPFNILLIHAWTTFTAGWNGPAWSLSAEWFAYLAFPFLLVGLRKIDGRESLILAALLLGGMTLFYELTAVDQMSHAGKTGMIRMLVGFSTGMFVYKIYMDRLLKLNALLVVLSLILCASILSLQPFILWFFAMAIYLCAQGDNKLAQVLSCKPVVFLGEISFSFYILQWIVIELGNYVIQKIGHEVLVEIAVVMAVAVTTLFSYYYIENPMRLWGRSRRSI